MKRAGQSLSVVAFVFFPNNHVKFVMFFFYFLLSGALSTVDLKAQMKSPFQGLSFVFIGLVGS